MAKAYYRYTTRFTIDFDDDVPDGMSAIAFDIHKRDVLRRMEEAVKNVIGQEGFRVHASTYLGGPEFTAQFHQI